MSVIVRLEEKMEKLKILLPKGRIYDNVVNLFSGAGLP